jgi:5-enolpyruvylshikimate-3-phosphate synthase
MWLAPSLVIDDPSCVEVSYPGFWDDLSTVTEQVDRVAVA